MCFRLLFEEKKIPSGAGAGNPPATPGPLPDETDRLLHIDC